MEWLAADLRSSACRLADLFLCRNNLGNEGTQVLAQHGLHHNRSLKCLDLSYNNVGDSGAKALAEHVIGRRKGDAAPLVELGLSRNRIRDGGFKAIGSALKRNNTLKSLRMACNGNTAFGASALSDSFLHCNYTLKDLGASYLDFGELRERNIQAQRAFARLCPPEADDEQESARQREPLPVSAWPHALVTLNNKTDLLFQLLKTKALPALLASNLLRPQGNALTRQRQEEEGDSRQRPRRSGRLSKRRRAG